MTEGTSSGRARRRAGTAAGPRPGDRGAGRTVATAAGALVVATLPMFLVGALSGRISDDLDLGGAAIGVLVASFFGAGAASSIPGGRLTDRIGASAALRLAATIAAACSLGVALFGAGFGGLLALFVVGGSAVAMADTGGARAIAASIPTSRQGMAFGGKEASIPAASMLAGLAVPALGATLGWRPAFAVAGGLAVVFLLLVPQGLGPVRRDERPAPDAATPVRVPPPAPAAAGSVAPSAAPSADPGTGPAAQRARQRVLVLLAVAAALGTGAATATPTFLVPAATAGALSESVAGLLLAATSIIGIAMRLVVGAVADRDHGGEIRLTVMLLLAGMVGLAALAVGSVPLIVLGAGLAMGGGWGWTGLVFLAGVRIQPTRPAAAAGIVLAGLGTGGATGPAAFGWLVDVAGYPTAWTAAAAAMGVACGFAGLAARQRRRLPAS